MFFSTGITEHTTELDVSLCTAVTLVTRQARKLVDAAPNRNELSFECHSIARAIAQSFPELTLVDGHVIGLHRTPKAKGKRYTAELRYANHSWLATPDDAIIDPYPLGALAVGPLLVVNKGVYADFGGQLYVPDDDVTAHVDGPELQRKSELLYGFLQQAIKLIRK
jgi:hypothetical protein